MKCTSDIRKHLFLDLIPFWFGMADVENGGYYGRVSSDYVIDKTADKGCILNSRILWFFSSVYFMTKEGKLSENDFMKYEYTSHEVLEAAHHAFEFLKDCFYDEVEGGVYWSVTYDGQPSDKTKHTYNMAFALNALSAYYNATGNEEALEIAFDIYATIEQCKDEEGYLEAFKSDFAYDINDKLSEDGVTADRTTNTLIHIMEAYTAFYKSTGDEDVKEQLINVLNIFATKVFDPENGTLKIFFDYDFNSLADIDSYGHTAMFAWDLLKTLKYLDDDELTEVFRPITTVLCEHVLLEGFDGQSTAAERFGNTIDDTRFWWVQAETLIGFIYAYLENPEDTRFIEAATNQWQFIWNHQINRHVRPSEWYNAVTPEGTPIEGLDLVSEWKCPYHNGRMCMEIIKHADELEDIF